MAVAIRVIGIEAATAVLARVKGVTRELAAKAKNETAKAIQGGARSRVRRRSGVLQDNIVIQEASAKRQNARVGVSRAGFYGRFLEFGTVKMRARPFMRPAAEAERGPHVQRMRAIGPELEREVS